MSLSVHHLLPGDRVEIREILNERNWTVRPVTVIEDSEDQFVSYLAPGTLIDCPVDVEHGKKCFNMWLTGKWELVQKEFSAPVGMSSRFGPTVRITFGPTLAETATSNLRG